MWTVSGPCGRNTEEHCLSLRQWIVAAVAAVSADAEPRRRACLTISGRDPSSTIGRAAVVDGSGVHQPLPHCDLSQSMLQNESRRYARGWTQSNRYTPRLARPSSGKGQSVRKRKKEACVRKRAKASFCPKLFLASVGEGKTISKYRKDQVVFSQGQVADAVFYVQQGKVRLTVVSEQGKEAVIAVLGPGQFFGEGCLNGHPLRIATTRAIDECVITRIEKATMMATIHNEPDFSEVFMSYLLTRNSRIEEDLIDQLFNSSEKRLARLLLLLANFGKEGKPEPIVGKFSQETLAEMIGTTRSRVSFFMNKFRKLGFIEYNGKIEVHNSLLNVILFDKPEIKTRNASTPI
jgi:CRP/FNR family transcriptional regulator, cyclic AMP receptor protein